MNNKATSASTVILALALSGSAELNPANGQSINETHKLLAADGLTRRYQHWYRYPNGSPCGALFNLSNGYELTWTP